MSKLEVEYPKCNCCGEEIRGGDEEECFNCQMILCQDCMDEHECD